MSAWGMKLYENDTTCEVRDTFISLISRQSKWNTSFNYKEAFNEVKYMYREAFFENDVKMALVDLAITFGCVTDEVIKEGLQAIDNSLANVADANSPDEFKEFLVNYRNYVALYVPKYIKE